MSTPSPPHHSQTDDSLRSLLGAPLLPPISTAREAHPKHTCTCTIKSFRQVTFFTECFFFLGYPLRRQQLRRGYIEYDATMSFIASTQFVGYRVLHFRLPMVLVSLMSTDLLGRTQVSIDYDRYEQSDSCDSGVIRLVFCCIVELCGCCPSPASW